MDDNIENVTGLAGEEMLKGINYLKGKRDEVLGVFNDSVKAGESFEIIKSRYDSLLRREKQFRLMEDALIVYRLTRKEIEDENKLG